MDRDSLAKKLVICIISVVIAATNLILFFLGTSLVWNTTKIWSCVLITTWLFFIIPALRYSYIVNKDKIPEELTVLIIRFIFTAIVFVIIIAPYFGIVYYFYRDN